MLYLVSFIILGYGLCYFRILRDKGVSVISYIVTRPLMVVLVFNAFYLYYTPDKTKETLQYLMLHLAALVFITFLAYLLAKSQGLGGKCLGPWLGGSMFPNVGYIGLPVVQSIYQQAAYVEKEAGAILYGGLAVIITNVLLGSIAEPMIAYFAGIKKEKEKPLWSSLISPAMLGFLLGLLTHMVNRPLPGFVHVSLLLTGKTIAPLAMLVIGCKLFKCSVRDIFADKSIYILSLGKLIIFPIILYRLGLLLSIDETMLLVLTIMFSCPSVAVLTIYAGQCGGDDLWCTRTVFLGTLLSVITIPVVLLLLIGR